MSSRKIWSNNQWVEIDSAVINGVETVADVSEATDPTKIYFVAADASPGDLITFRINGKLGSGIWFGGNEIWVPPVLAVGGTETNITIAGTPYRVHTITQNQDFEVLTSSLVVDYQIVAGGGSGGSAALARLGGGGGAGGVVEGSSALASGVYPIVIGQGGVAGDGSDGEDTVFNGLVAAGGGRGGYGSGGTGLSQGQPGGSGGGGGGSAGASGTNAGGLGIAGQGYGGGTGRASSGTTNNGGGGGGAGGPGRAWNDLNGGGGAGILAIDNSGIYLSVGGPAGWPGQVISTTYGSGGAGGQTGSGLGGAGMHGVVMIRYSIA